MTHYGTVIDADTFFQQEEFDPGQIWTSATETEKTIALTKATRLIDNLNFNLYKYDEDQELEFPRGDETEVPENIERACYLIAWHILDGRDIEFEQEHGNEQAASMTGTRLSKDTSFVPEARAHSIPSEGAWRLIKPYLRDGLSISISRID